MSPIIWITGGCILAAGVVAAAIRLRKKQKCTEIGGLSAENEMHPKRKDAVKEFSEKASVFTGLYEPMYMIEGGLLKNWKAVFEDWDARVEYMDNAPALISFWNDIYSGHQSWDEKESARKAGELLMFARDAGLKRGEETQVTVNRDIFRYYSAKDGVRLEPGSVAKVEKPYWLAGDHILEKGIIDAPEM
jgi:hypothetical protein